MAKELPKLKLGKSAAFVKTQLKQLKQENDTWEADFRALPKPHGQNETHYLGLVVALPKGNPLVSMLVEYTPNVDDLADLLADAMRRPMTDSAHRPRQLLLRGNPRWEELFPHLKPLGIEVSIQNELPNVEEVYEDFLRQMRRTRPDPLILYTSRPTDIHKDFPAIAMWVQCYGHIEIGDQEGFGFTVRALDNGGLVFEDGGTTCRFTPDGKMWAMSGFLDPITVWNAAAGTNVRNFAADAPARRVVGISPNGKILATATEVGFGWGPNHVRFWDIETGQPLHLHTGHRTVVTCVTHAADGKLLVSSDEEGRVLLWDLPTAHDIGSGKLRREIRADVPFPLKAVAFSSDGRRLVAAGHRVFVHDLAKEAAEPSWPLGKDVEAVSLSSDGRLLAVAFPQELQIWDTLERKKTRAIATQSKDIRHRRVRVSPDGSLLALIGGAETDEVQIWKTATGRLFKTLPPPKHGLYVELAFTSDARFLATSESQGRTPGVVRIWEIATGQIVSDLRGIDVGSNVLAFSPSGLTLLHTCWVPREGPSERSGLLRDLSTASDLELIVGPEFDAICMASGLSQRALPAHPGPIRCAAFAPDGKSFVTASSDGTVIVSKATEFLRRFTPLPPVDLAEQTKLWNDLADTDAKTAQRALVRLASDPEATIKHAQTHMKAAIAPDASKVANWIKELGSETFTVRANAAAELAKLGDLVDPALLKAAEKKESVEVGRRLEELLAKLSVPMRKQLHELRVVALLERIASDDGLALLELLAKGTPEAAITKEARAAKSRLRTGGAKNSNRSPR